MMNFNNNYHHYNAWLAKNITIKIERSDDKTNHSVVFTNYNRFASILDRKKSFSIVDSDRSNWYENIIQNRLIKLNMW